MPQQTKREASDVDQPLWEASECVTVVTVTVG